MPSTDDNRRQAVSRPMSRGSTIEEFLSDVESLVNTFAADGKLDDLIALACKRAQTPEPPSTTAPGHVHHAGVRAAVEAYAGWERTKEGSMDTEVRTYTRPIDPPASEPEALPLSLAGRWVAWSSDGMRIIASAETSEEAERLAIGSGEPEPILERHPGRYRL